MRSESIFTQHRSFIFRSSNIRSFAGNLVIHCSRVLTFTARLRAAVNSWCSCYNFCSSSDVNCNTWIRLLVPLIKTVNINCIVCQHLFMLLIDPLRPPCWDVALLTRPPAPGQPAACDVMSMSVLEAEMNGCEWCIGGHSTFIHIDISRFASSSSCSFEK